MISFLASLARKTPIEASQSKVTIHRVTPDFFLLFLATFVDKSYTSDGWFQLKRWLYTFLTTFYIISDGFWHLFTEKNVKSASNHRSLFSKLSKADLDWALSTLGETIQKAERNVPPITKFKANSPNSCESRVNWSVHLRNIDSRHFYSSEVCKKSRLSLPTDSLQNHADLPWLKTER